MPKAGRRGFDITYLPVQTNGLVDLQALEAAIRPDTSVVSIMTVNNETGVIQPIKEIGAMLRKHRGVYFHTDAAQAAGKIPLDVNEMNIDLMSISGTNIWTERWSVLLMYGEDRGSGLSRLSSGGGQERGLRSGTLPTALTVGLGEGSTDRQAGDGCEYIILFLFGKLMKLAREERSSLELHHDLFVLELLASP